MKKTTPLLIFAIFFFHCKNNTPAANKEEQNLTTTTTQNIQQEVVAKEKIEDITSSFIAKYDISKNLSRSYFGAFGNNYQRIDLEIKTINKNIDSPSEYTLQGTTIMKNKKVPYTGIITIKQVQKSNLNPYQIYDSTHYTLGIDADYKLVEDQSISGLGIFQGKLGFTLIMDKDKKLDDDLLDWWQDGYSNFQFQGTWTSFKGKEYKCIFGDGRLENSGDLDVGDGEFVANPKYHQYGWAEYK